LFDSGLQTSRAKVGENVNLESFRTPISVLLSDIDDTMTDEGELRAPAYQAMWDLKQAGIHVVPVTGRPAGWCELIARQWPVAGVVGENGGFYFRYDSVQKKMLRNFSQSDFEQKQNRQRLQHIQQEILAQVPGSAMASDQFCRLLDLAVDFCEDVPRLPKSEVQKIKTIFEKHGAVAKVSSIHVNGWFGQHDKLSKSREFLANEMGMNDAQMQSQCGFVGDSPNDEPMWGAFQNSFAVSNIQEFWNDIQKHPKYVMKNRGGAGFVELAQHLIALKK
jgi:HAD superfamily hydrolase (TIGR01484 family)